MNSIDFPPSLLKTVSSSPNSVSLPTQRSTRLSYQGRNEKEKNRPLNDEAMWDGYIEFLHQNYVAKTAKVRLSYSRKYCHILVDGNAQDLMVMTRDKRIHVMKALSALSKYLGRYGEWKRIMERYQLKWSYEDGLEAFNNIMTNNYDTYTSMAGWLKDAVSKLPTTYGNVLLFNVLTGLRPDEACKSITLLKEKGQEGYLNRKTMTLEHFRYPSIFIRRTKKAYISPMISQTLEIAKQSSSCGYNALRLAVKKRGMAMNMSFCRKIFATYLRNGGVEQEVIDLLQGRTPKSVFARHYFRPDFSYERVQNMIDTLYHSLTR